MLEAWYEKCRRRYNIPDSRRHLALGYIAVNIGIVNDIELDWPTLVGVTGEDGGARGAEPGDWCAWKIHRIQHSKSVDGIEIAYRWLWKIGGIHHSKSVDSLELD